MKKYMVPGVILVLIGALLFAFVTLRSESNTKQKAQSNSQSVDEIIFPEPEQTSASAQSSDVIVYQNTQYGFNFTLPASWKNYKIIMDKWSGVAAGSDKVLETGPIVTIRHPLWTSANPRQDIPIMVFTLAQWNSLQKGNFHIGAAPIGPSELGRNSKYVFALPARYNYAFPTGYQEVETILSGKPLQPTEVFK